MIIEQISIILAIIGTSISVFSFLIAIFSLRESKITRESTKQPLLVLESAFGDLKITNIGHAPAFNVSVYGKQVNLGELIEENKDMQWAYSYILPGESVSQKAPISTGDFEGIEITINFESVFKEKYQMKYHTSVDLRGEGKNVTLLDSKTI